MVKIKAKLPLYDSDSYLELSCYEEDDLETLTFIFGHQRYQTKPGNSHNIRKNLKAKKAPTGICLQWNMVSGVKNLRISLCTLPVECVT